MERMYLGDPNDADVDALIAQLHDESLLKMNLNTHNVSKAGGGFDYPAFTDVWAKAEEDSEGLNGQLTSRFSNLKLPIPSPKNGEKDSDAAKKKARDTEDAAKTARKAKEAQAAKKAKDSALARQARDLEAAAKNARQAKNAKDSCPPRQENDSETGTKLSGAGAEIFGSDTFHAEVMNEMGLTFGKESDGGRSAKADDDSEVFGNETFHAEVANEAPRSRTSSFRREGDGRKASLSDDSEVFGGGTFHAEVKNKWPSFRKDSDARKLAREASNLRSDRTEFFSVGDPEEFEDLDNIDAILNERFRALKEVPQSPGGSRRRNRGLDNLLEFSGQLSLPDYEGYGSNFSAPSSPGPSANLLRKSKTRSSPRITTNSVVASCHCSAPSPLKLLKHVSLKNIPGLPPFSPSPRADPSTPTKNGGNLKTARSMDSSVDSIILEKRPTRQFKVEGFGNSKPVSKESAKKGKKSKKKSKDEEVGGGGAEEENTKNATKDMRKLFSSVADRVGMERSRVSSAEEDEDILGSGDMLAWSVLEREREFSRASTAEEKLNRQADRVVEWARDAARLAVDDPEAGGSSEGEQFQPRNSDEELEPDDDDDEDIPDPLSDGPPTERRSKIELSQRQVVKSKKKWNLF